MCGIAEG